MSIESQCTGMHRAVQLDWSKQRIADESAFSFRTAGNPFPCPPIATDFDNVLSYYSVIRTTKSYFVHAGETEFAGEQEQQ